MQDKHTGPDAAVRMQRHLAQQHWELGAAALAYAKVGT